MTHRLIGSALLLAAGAACASTQEAPADRLAGCYYFDRDEIARQLDLPWGVRLTTEPLADWPPLSEQEDVRVAVTLRDYDETTDYPFGYWRPLTGDSLRLGYPGAGGFVVDLVVGDRALTGLARPVGDAGLDLDRRAHPVRLQHARCP
ncbi:MAG: hypothetical protein ACOCVZ_09305 [Gemmatimonadota bacterium]